MKKNQIIALLCLLTLSIASCKDEKIKILYEKSFEEIKDIANSERKNFCVIMARKDCPPCDFLINSLYSLNTKNAKRIIYNIVDISDSINTWYSEWTGVTASPTTVVFSAEGDLLALVSGSNKRAISCIEDVINEDITCALFTYNGQVGISDKTELFKSLNNTLKCKEKLEKGEDISEQIAQSFTQIYYPYNLYLAAKNEHKKGNYEKAKKYCEDLLTFRHNTKNIRIYSTLFNEAQYIINPKYNPDNEPILSTNNQIKIENYQKGEIRKIYLNLENTGKKELIIYDIILDCSCLSLKSEKNIEIVPGESKEIELEFTSKDNGRIMRRIEIVSNSNNSPVEQITIIANN